MLTPDRAIDDFLGDCRRQRWSERSISSYANTLDAFAERLPDDLDVSKITADDVRRYLATRRTSRPAPSPATKRTSRPGSSGSSRRGRSPATPWTRSSARSASPAEDLDVVTVDTRTTSASLLSLAIRAHVDGSSPSAIPAYLGPRRRAIASLRLATTTAPRRHDPVPREGREDDLEARPRRARRSSTPRSPRRDTPSRTTTSSRRRATCSGRPATATTASSGASSAASPTAPASTRTSTRSAPRSRASTSSAPRRPLGAEGAARPPQPEDDARRTCESSTSRRRWSASATSRGPLPIPTTRSSVESRNLRETLRPRLEWGREDSNLRPLILQQRTRLAAHKPR
jgi:hypothetical protein